MAEVLQSLSNALADAVQSAGAGVVRVEARRRLPASGIVWSADGVIVTSHHVVERDDNINVGLPNGETVPATLVGRDPYRSRRAACSGQRFDRHRAHRAEQHSRWTSGAGAGATRQ